MLLTILLIIHVIAVVLWIGGVSFVTLIIFPLMYQTEGSLEKALLFQGVEHRFARIVKWLIAIVAATGLWLLAARYGFAILGRAQGLPIVIMIVALLIYTTVLLSEKKLFGKLFKDPEKVDMNKALKMINGMHWFLLTVSYAAIAAGIWLGHAG